MIIELLVNLKINSGKVMIAGQYDNSKIEFPAKLWEEIEIHKKTGRRTLRIIQDDPPAQNNKKVIDEATTIDDESRFVTTDEETSKTETKTKPKKKSRRTRTS